MKKHVHVRDLRKGMYVAELDRPWRGTSFLFQGFEITSDEEIARLREICQHVYVLEDHLGAAAPAHPVRTSPHPLQVLNTMSADIKRPATNDVVPRVLIKSDIKKIAALMPRYPDITPVEEELPHARAIELGARETLFTLLDDAKHHRTLDISRATRVVTAMTESVIRNPDALVWLTQLKKKHEYTATHSLRVCMLALALGRHLGYDRERLYVLGTGALLHDIGKLKVPNELLDNPGTLTPDEFEIMKRHVPEGLKLLEGAPGIPLASLEIVGRHHERYSGNGYVFGMSGDTIGELGLISGIVDTYDAITSDRAYHDGISSAEALAMIYEGRTRAFHPWLVEQFIQSIGIFPIGCIVEMNTGDIGVVITANRTRRLRPRVALILGPDHKPLAPPVHLDLAQTTRNSSGRFYEIRRVLASGSFGISPTDYLPGPR